MVLTARPPIMLQGTLKAELGVKNPKTTRPPDHFYYFIFFNRMSHITFPDDCYAICAYLKQPDHQTTFEHEFF